jgi:hypothetical protein
MAAVRTILCFRKYSQIARFTAKGAERHEQELHRATLSSISDAVFLTDDEEVFTCQSPFSSFSSSPRERARSSRSRLMRAISSW